MTLSLIPPGSRVERPHFRLHGHVLSHLVFAHWYSMTPTRIEMLSTGVAAVYMAAWEIKCHFRFSIRLSVKCSPAKTAACKGVYAALLHCMQMITKGFHLVPKAKHGVEAKAK